MARKLVVFEDEGFSKLYSLTLTRPAWDLVCGILRLKEKLLWGLQMAAIEEPAWREFAGDRVGLRFHLRSYLAAAYPGAVQSYEDEAQGNGLASLVNGRLLFNRKIIDQIDPSWQGSYVHRGSVVWATVPVERLKALHEHLGRPLKKGLFSDLETKTIDARLVRRPWDFIKLTGPEIERDFKLLGGAVTESAPPSGVHLVGQEKMRIGRSVRLSAGVVIDATDGPVNLDSDVTVMANASLRGPLHIGRGSIIKMGAKIYGDTSIGPVCKVGGEVAESTLLGYTNKQHDGFLGHSYIGEWANIGAGTDTSDMKNNYSTVRFGPPGREEDTEELFVGLFMGDHSKSGIGTTFTTGSMVGVCSNVFGAGYPPRYIPSFCWGGSGGFKEYDLKKAVQTAGRAMQRRDRKLGPRGEALLKHIYEITAEDRRAFLGSPACLDDIVV
jgi:UDP-N-acetylglucosamine diphosphorylase/glucosamine-1-phosphate N-acetyltransferase